MAGNSSAVPTPITISLLSRSRPTMSMLSIASTLSSGRGGSSTKCPEPSSPASSPVKAQNTRVCAGRCAGLRALTLGARHAQHGGHARGVVVRAEVRQVRIGRQRALLPVAQMIVVRAHHQRAIGVAPGDHADHVADGGARALERHRDGGRFGEREAVRLLAAIDRHLRVQQGGAPSAPSSASAARSEMPAASSPLDM